MWKPWIFAAIGSIVMLNVSANSFSSSYDVADFEDSAVSSFDLSNHRCKDEIEKACGAKVNQEASTIVINKKGIFKGTGNDRADLVNALRSTIGTLATPLPGNFNSLCTNVNSNVAQDIQETTMDGVDGLLARWNLPQQVSSFLANIKFSEDVNYQTYRFALEKGHSELREFIAAGRNNNGKIVMSFMNVHVTAQPIQQWVVTRSCKRILFIKKCHNNRNPRGFTTGELNNMQNGLLYHGYSKLNQEVNNLALFVESLPQIQSFDNTQQVMQESETEQQNWLERAVIHSYNNLKAQFDGEEKREIVQKISNFGFTTFVQNAKIKFLKELEGAHYKDYVDYMMANLVVKDDKTRNKIKAYLNFAPYSKVGEWNMMRSMFNADSESSANYFCIMTYVDSQKRMSIYEVSIANTFQIAPDLLILRNSKSSWGGLFTSESEKIEEIPHAMTPVDLQQLLDYFDLIAFKRFMALFGKTAAVVEKKHEIETFFDDLEEYRVKETPKVSQYLEAFSAGLDVVEKAWGIAKSIFSTEKKNQIVDKIIKMGFDQLETSSLIQMYKGVPPEKLDMIKNIINKSTETPADKKDQLDDWWTLAEFLDAATWNFQNLAFTKDTNGNAKYLALMYNRDTNGKLTFLVCDTKANFNVAQDMFIWEKFSSKWGGMIQKTEQSIQYLPHSVTLEESQVLLNIFDTIALGKYTLYLKTFIESQKMLVAEFGQNFLN